MQNSLQKGIGTNTPVSPKDSRLEIDKPDISQPGTERNPPVLFTKPGVNPIEANDPDQSNNLHLYDDLNAGDLAHHHSIGMGQGQAASGIKFANHTHSGSSVDGTKPLTVPHSVIYGQVRVADNTASGAYVNMAAPSVLVGSFTKLYTSTAVDLFMSASCIALVAGTTISTAFGLLINGVDIDMTKAVALANDGHTMGSGMAKIAAGTLVAGIYVVQARWKKLGGGGTPSTGTDDWLSFSATEVWS